MVTNHFLNPAFVSNQSISITFLQISNGYFFGCVMVLFWDFASSFFLERKLVWRVSNTFVKIIYLWNRYLTLFIGFFGLGFWVHLFKIDHLILSSEILIFTPLLFGIGLLGVHLVLVVQINTLYRDTPVIPYMVILFVTINLLIQILCFVEIRTEFTNILLSHTSSYNVVFHKPTYILIICSFISPILLHMIFFFITSYSTRSHGKATDGILIGSVDKPLCYHHLIFTITTSILYIISLMMFLQPSSFKYKLMNYIPALIFTQVLFSRMYLGIKKEHLRSKSIWALGGNGLRQIRLSSTSSWFEVQNHSSDSQLISISSSFDLNHIDRHRHDSLQSEEEFNLNFKDYQSRMNSINHLKIYTQSPTNTFSRNFQLEHFPVETNHHYPLNPTRTRTISEMKTEVSPTTLNEQLQHSRISLIRWPHNSDRSVKSEESSNEHQISSGSSRRSKFNIFNIVPSPIHRSKSQETIPIVTFLNQI
ncbi:hypothetical protein DFH28DRAFT_961635 [Melampsora americana]|nr:hypothetical protein DFH28DRAFT_961635 [Melampsora americana]